MKIETVNLWNDESNCRYISYLYEKEESLKMVEKRPAMIVCPGGGYLSTEYREGEPVAMHFLNLGFQVFVLHYHTKSTGGNTLYPQQLFDIAKMVMEIRTRADEWNIDPDKIGIIGFSAGGNLCSLLSTRWHSPILKEKFGVEDSEIFKPNAAILCYALTTPTCFTPGKVAPVELPEELKPFAFLLDKLTVGMYKSFFGTETPTEAQLEAIHSVKDVDEKTPPTFIWTTANDFMVYCENSIDYARALSKYNVPFELHIFENGRHGLSKGTKDSASNPEEINPNVAQWTTLVDKWIVKYLSI